MQAKENDMHNSFAGETGTVKLIPIDLVTTVEQVRTTFNDKTIRELAADIKAHGVLQPLVVKPNGKGFTVIIGERRLRAIHHLGGEFVPAIISSIKDEDREEIQLIENIQRENLNAGDLAGSIHKLWKKHGSVAEVAKRCAKSKSWVSKRLALALDVGPLTVELLDANTKDVELLYAFATLEKADEQRARALLPDILDKAKTRKDVQNELQLALGKKTDNKAEPKTTNENLDLFDDMTLTVEISEKDVIEILKEQLAAAQKAWAILMESAKPRTDGKCWIVSNQAMAAAKAIINEETQEAIK